MIAGRIKLQESYAEHNHAHASDVVKLAAPGDDIESLLNGFLKRIHDGTLTKGQIDPSYYDYVSKQLKSGVAKGLGGAQFGAADYRNTLKAYLDQNIYSFSSARSLYMLEQYRSLLTDAQGNVLSEGAFISKVQQISYVDNITHLKIERSSAIACAQAAESWEGLQAFPALEYRTTGGDRVCPICGGLDGLIVAIGDPILNIIYVPNHYGCMCKFVPAAGDAILSDPTLVVNRMKAANIPPYFKRNVGTEQLVYGDDHPYIQKIGINKLGELDAVKNYGLPSGEKIYKTAVDLPGFKPVADKATANAWWEDTAGSAHGSFDLISADDLTVTFDEKFRYHVLEQNKDERFAIIKQVKDVLQNPDEIWSNRIRGSIQNTYIKFYDGMPVALGVEAGTDIRAITIYEVKKGGNINYKALQNIRKGILKYKSR